MTDFAMINRLILYIIAEKQAAHMIFANHFADSLFMNAYMCTIPDKNSAVTAQPCSYQAE
jgi:hypothetical protein